MSRTPTVQPTLIFIPDISGFTRFVRETEISHSQHIIEELLEVIIDANEIGLEVSEIEGDAILFYRHGEPPTPAALTEQVRRMYLAFHAHLRKYESLRICQCGACSSANVLRLKFVAHFGETSMKQVKEHSKLFGEEVIAAHRLLKNSIPSDEYALFTSNLMEAYDSWTDAADALWSKLTAGREQYDVGSIHYCYAALGPLMSQVPEPVVEDFSLPGVTARVIEFERDIDAPLDLAFDVLSDLSIRHEWNEPLVGSDQLNHKISQNGSTHRCVIEGTDKDPQFISHSFNYRDDMVTFTETNARDQFASIYTLTRLDENRTHVEVVFMISKSAVKELFVRLFLRKKLVRNLETNFTNFNDYCRRLVDNDERHAAQIVLEPSA